MNSTATTKKTAPQATWTPGFPAARGCDERARVDSSGTAEGSRLDDRDNVSIFGICSFDAGPKSPEVTVRQGNDIAGEAAGFAAATRLLRRDGHHRCERLARAPREGIRDGMTPDQPRRHGTRTMVVENNGWHYVC